MKAWNTDNIEHRRNYMKAWNKSNPHLGRFHTRMRHARKLQAMPKWADKNKIESIYMDAWRKQIETEVVYHVDHIVPLKHPLVCGLHVENNLRIVPAKVNLSKSNSFNVQEVFGEAPAP